MLTRSKIILIACAAVLAAVFLWSRGKRTAEVLPGAAVAPSPRAAETPDQLLPAPQESALPSPSPLALPETTKLFRARDVRGMSSVYDFQLYVPRAWVAEYVRQIEAINIYDPSAAGTANLEKSQVFVRYFRANTFSTLSSVKILSRKDLSIAGYPAVDYIIEKKPGYANFRYQPLWRNQKHRVIDVRASDANPSVFYVFAKHPGLDDILFETILDTFKISPESSP